MQAAGRFPFDCLFSRLNKPSSSFSLHVIVQSPDHLLSIPLLDLHPYVNVFILLMSSKLYSAPDAISQVEGAVSLPQPVGCTLTNTVQDAAALHCCKSALLVLINVLVLCQLRNVLCVAKVLVLDLLTVWFYLLGEDDMCLYRKEAGYASENVGG